VQKHLASAEDKKQLMLSLKEGDFGFEADEAELDSFLQENIEDYPLISQSTCWELKPDDGTIRFKPDNDPCNKHFSV
jgi:hypothetical protein